MADSMGDTNIHAADGRIRSAKPPFYRAEIGNRLTPEARRLLEDYSEIPSEKLEAHLHAVRDEAWEICPYPCVGLWNFLHHLITYLPFYQQLLARAREPGARILDVGCGFGQELRQMVADGAPVENFCATDIEDRFWDLGFKLYKDERRLARTRFLRGNILDLDETAITTKMATKQQLQVIGKLECLGDWKGRFDVVYAGLVLHLWDWEEQVQAATNLALMTRPGGWIILWQTGGVGHAIRRGMGGERMFLQNHETCQEMWRLVMERTGLEFQSESWLSDLDDWDVPVEDQARMVPGMRGFQTIARRIDA